MRLSRRLNLVLDIMESCSLLLDIGCDHGYVCIEAINKKKAKRAIAADTAKLPLAAAGVNIEACGLSGSIDTLLSDGFKGIDKNISPDCVNITGMGGRLIIKILREGLECGADFGKIKQLILGPQSDTELLRHYVVDELGAYIKNEYCIYDDGKYYMLFDIRQQEADGCTRDNENASCKEYCDNKYSEEDYLCGKRIHKDSMDAYRSFLNNQKKKLFAARKNAESGDKSEVNIKKISELNNKLLLITKKLHEVSA